MQSDNSSRQIKTRPTPTPPLPHTPEPRNHLGKANDLLDAIGDQISQVGQHRKAGALFLAGIRATALLVVHHQQVVEVHFGVY